MTEPIFNELRILRSRVESIEHGQEVLIRAQAKQILGDILPVFEGDPILANVYLLVDGQRGQRQIGIAMQDVGLPGASEATISRKLDLLRQLDLVKLVDRTAAGKIYERTHLDRLLHVARHVERILKDTKKAR